MTHRICDHTKSEPGRIFCTLCGKLIDRGILRGVKLLGSVGTERSMNPKIQEFWRTGNPDNL